MPEPAQCSELGLRRGVCRKGPAAGKQPDWSLTLRFCRKHHMTPYSKGKHGWLCELHAAMSPPCPSPHAPRDPWALHLKKGKG